MRLPLPARLIPQQRVIRAPEANASGRLPVGVVSRRWRGLALIAGGMATLAAVGAAVGWAALPGVGDAESRVRRMLAAHGGIDTGPLPSTAIGEAVVAVEDQRFYAHHGVDLYGVGRAVVGNFTRSGDQGGATIDQQLAKRIYVAGGGPAAKLEQVGMALKLEQHYSKDEILELYLNAVYYGNGWWGLEQAARGYFDKNPAQLDWAEASLLAGLPQAPSALNPIDNFAAARRRQRVVLDALVRTHRLSRAAADTAYRELTSLRA